MHVAVITAHPDDAEIFAGGMIAAWRGIGAEVTVFIATDGSRGGKGDPRELAERRAAEAAEAAAALGARLVLLGHPDGALDEAALIPDLAARLAEVAPDLVLTHPPEDYHADHRTTSAATRRAATFRAPVAWLEPMMGLGFQPTHWIDTTACQEVKDHAIRCHVSQDPDRFVRQSRLLAHFRASQCGHDGFAETIRHDPVYPFADIRALLPPPPPVRPVRDRSR